MDLAQKLNLLRRINRTKVSGKPIYDHFIYKGISLWSFFQEDIWNDIKKGPVSFQKAGVRQSRWVKRKSFLLRFLSFGISFFSVLYFMVFRRRLAIYTSDTVTMPGRRDYRIGKVYDFLEKHQIPFEELIHMPIHRKFLANFVKRKRPAYYLEAADFIFGLFARYRKKWYFEKIRFEDVDFREFPESEIPFVWNILSSYAQRAEATRFRVIFFAKLFRMLGIRKVLMIDDSRFYGELILAAKIARAQSIAFQHGSFTKYYTAHALYEIPSEKCIAPDVYCVWNEHWRKKLLSLNPIFKFHARKIIVSGKPTATETNFKFLNRVEDGVCTILVPYELGHHKEVSPYIKTFLKCPDTAVIFKLRKDYSSEGQITQYGLQDFIAIGRGRAIFDISVEDMVKIDVVVGTCSTLLSEMVQAGKPIGILQSPDSEAEELVSDDLADLVTGDMDTMCEQIHYLAATPRSILEKRSKTLAVDANIENTLGRLFNMLTL